MTAKSEAILYSLEALNIYEAYCVQSLQTRQCYGNSCNFFTLSLNQDNSRIPIDFAACLLNRAIAQVNNPLVIIVNAEFCKSSLSATRLNETDSAFLERRC